MEGLLLVPPDRTALIGRPVWKPRYMVFGLAGNCQQQVENVASSKSQTQSTSRKGSGLKSTSSKPSLTNINSPTTEKDNLMLSIYKQRGDQEPIQQFPLSRLKSLDIVTIQHPKKAGPATPTLIIHLEPDAAAEKLRKRRSSRTAGLSSSSPATILHFRSLDNERYNIYDWQMTIQPMLQMSFGDDGPDEIHEFDRERQQRRQTNPTFPMSPLSPIFAQFANPFSNNQRPTTSSGNRPTMPQPRSSDHTFSSMQSSREKQIKMISPEPSLRSRRSDLSSQASSQQKPFGSAYYSSAIPSTSSELPSPNSAHSSADQENQFIEGWTMAQGRRCGSALSSHTRNSNSINTPAITSGNTTMASSPIPRESILDRAFQMRCIPGSEKLPTSTPSDEKALSSIARFEALMKKVDEEKAKEKELLKSQNQKSGWELDEESEESEAEGPLGKGNKKHSDDDVDPLTVLPESEIPKPARRALDYISGRFPAHSHLHSPHTSISPLSPPPPSQYYRERPYSTTVATRGRGQTISSLNDTSSIHEGVKFHDSFESTRGRPSISRQNSNQSKTSGHRRTRSSRPTSLALPSRPITMGSHDLEFAGPFTAGLATSMEKERDSHQRIGMERSHTTANLHQHRLSTSSITQTSQDKKRLSFTEFTRRLSSTSSLLLVQTNTNLSSSSGRVSSDSSGWIDTSAAGTEDTKGGLRHSAIGIPRDASGYGYGRDGAMGSRDGNGGGLSRDEKRCGWRGSVGVFGGEGGFL